jgi:hypothetical protein
MPPLALAVVWILGANLTVGAENACPSNGAVTAELKRLGALAKVEKMGGVEVQVRGPILRIVLSDQQGRFLGVREVAVPPDCATRANLAAVMIAAWSGTWAATQLREHLPASPPTAARAELPPAPPATSSSRRWAFAGGAYAFGVHDGDRAAAGLGASGDAAVGPLVIAALFEASTERERPLGPGRAVYRFLRGGIGLGLQKCSTRLSFDTSLIPMFSRLALQGKDLQINHHVDAWSVALMGRVRAGWRTKFVTPYLFFELSHNLLRQDATLDDRPEQLTLSATNAALGLGASFSLPHL